MNKRFCLVFCLCFVSTIISASIIENERDSVSVKSISGNLHLADYEWVHKGGWDKLYKIPQHPSFDKMRTSDVVDSLLDIINRRKELIGDTLKTSSFFYCWKPYFEWLKSIDPHYTISPLIIYDIDYDNPVSEKEIMALNKNFNKKAAVIPVTVLNVNDTIIVEQSLDPNLQYGDILLSVNKIPLRRVEEVSYTERHAPLYLMLTYWSFSTLCDKYDVEIRRGDEIMTLTINGVNITDALYRLSAERAIEDNISILPEDIGYIKIPEFFPDNSRLLHILTKSIKQFKSQGIGNIILDLRGNPGGNGDSFDKLLSLFIDKEQIDYCRLKLLKVSNATVNDYQSLTKEMIGQLVEISETESPHTIPLRHELFIGGISYYPDSSEQCNRGVRL